MIWQENHFRSRVIYGLHHMGKFPLSCKLIYEFWSLGHEYKQSITLPSTWKILKKETITDAEKNK